MFNRTITTPISLFVSLLALSGVALHDTKIDKFATTFAGIPAMMTHAEGSARITSDPHTHVERMSLNELSSQPRMSPRSDQKKHMIQKNMPRGAQRFDGYTLPIGALC